MDRDLARVLLIVLLIAVCVAGAALYFLPTIVAGSRGVSRGGVFLLNLFLGWTFVGWLGALIWAASAEAGSAKRTARCSHCRERMNPRATVCPHCRRDLTPGPPLGEVLDELFGRHK